MKFRTSYIVYAYQIKYFIIIAVSAEACNKLGPIFASLRAGNIVRFEEMSQRWRAVGNTVSDLTRRDLNLRSPSQRRTRYRSTNWLVTVYAQYKHNSGQ